MRVTRESLLRIARETAQERAFNERDVVAAYLIGSLRTAEPMLGGTTDVDLVFVYNGEPAVSRSFVRLTPDFHIDILRRSRDKYRSLRDLRADPWLGYEMYDPLLLYEREKFFEFVQAGLRGGYEFDSPQVTLDRCRALYTQARGSWLRLSEAATQEPDAAALSEYLEAVYAAANSVAEMSGPPLAERRLLLEFPGRAEAAGRTDLHAGLTGLLGGAQLDAGRVDAWINAWTGGFEAAATSPGVDVRVHPARLNYYAKAVRAMLGSGSPMAAVWPILVTWTLAARVLDGAHLTAWRAACVEVELLGSAFAERLQSLDHFLDEVDMLLDEFAVANGITSAGP